MRAASLKSAGAGAGATDVHEVAANTHEEAPPFSRADPALSVRFTKYRADNRSTTGIRLPDYSSPFHAERRAASGSSTTTSEKDRMTRVGRRWVS
jgi:hypothetical protein